MQVSLAMLLKTHVEKMSAFGLATMLMKTHGLAFACHDVDEKKGSYQKRARVPCPQWSPATGTCCGVTSGIMIVAGRGGWGCPRAANPLSACHQALLSSIPSPASSLCARTRTTYWPVALRRTPRFSKMQVHPGMFMKTKQAQNSQISIPEPLTPIPEPRTVLAI